MAFLYSKDKKAEKEIRETTPFTIITNIKYLGVTLTNQVKDLYDKNFKSLKKEIKDLEHMGTGDGYSPFLEGGAKYTQEEIHRQNMEQRLKERPSRD